MGTLWLLCVQLRTNRHHIAIATLRLTNESISRAVFVLHVLLSLFLPISRYTFFFFLIKKMKVTRTQSNLQFDPQSEAAKLQKGRKPAIAKHSVAYVEISFRRWLSKLQNDFYLAGYFPLKTRMKSICILGKGVCIACVEKNIL